MNKSNNSYGKHASKGCLRQVLAGKFTHVWLLRDLKIWALNTGDCLIQVAFILCMSGALLMMI